jgi:hypothetical protein
VAPTAILNHADVYRSDKVPPFDTGGLAVRAADPSLLTARAGAIRKGAFLNGATGKFPVTRSSIRCRSHPVSTAPRSSGSASPRNCSATMGSEPDLRPG